MLIPAAISLILSIIFLNFSASAYGAILSVKNSATAGGGQVLGVVEYNRPEKVFVDPGKVSNVLVKVIEDAKTLPLPRIVQPPQLDQPMRRLPENPEKIALKLDYDLAAANGAILDYEAGELVFSKQPDRPWPIASITKLFTAYTFLDYNPGWDSNLTIKAEDKREGGKINLFPGDTVKVRDLFYFSLVGSDNSATAALVRSTGLSEEEFVKKMNEKIAQAGLKNTRLLDPVGLADGNISTARDVAMFAKLALTDPEISRASVTKKYEFTTAQGRKKTIATTDELLASFPSEGIEILGGKTGYVNASGYNFVSRFKNQSGKSIITVVLGAASDSGRFSSTRKLVELYYGREQ